MNFSQSVKSEIKSNLPKRENKRIIAEKFISTGTIAEPIKYYHLEFAIRTEAEFEKFNELLISEGFRLKSTVRGGRYILYLKENEPICDLLTFMGAQNSALEITNIVMEKSVKNNIQRGNNCISANIDRTIKAAFRQLEDINLIKQKMGLAKLPYDLKEAAELRLENETAPLGELADLTDPKIKRAALKFRYDRIHKLAEKIRNA
jgi:DNA-binding protein WhiA